MFEAIKRFFEMLVRGHSEVLSYYDHMATREDIESAMFYVSV